MDNTQSKLWMFYPGSSNREVFEKESSISEKYARCEETLTGGCYVVTLPGEGIVMPPGCIHATLTITPGVLFGSTVMVAEGVFDAAQSFQHDVMTDEVDSFNDLKPLVCSLQEAFLAQYEDLWRKALGLCCGLSVDDLNKDNQGKSTIKDLIEKLRYRLNQKEYLPCTSCKVELLEHFPFNMNMAARGAGKRKLDPPPHKKARPI